MHRPGRLGGWAFFIILGFAAAAAGEEAGVRFAVLERGKPLVVEVPGGAAADLARLQQAKDFDWPALLSVRVAGAKTDLAGDYSVAGTAIRFESRHQPAAGLTFRAVFDPGKLPSQPKSSRVTAEATLARPAIVSTTTVERIYPSADKLPENHLRFYVHFSAP